MRTLDTPSEFLLSSSEHKILFAIGFLLCGLYFTNISNKLIAAYNEDIRSEQTEKQRIANDERGFSFNVCVFRSTPAYEILLGFQFLLIPFLTFLLKKQTFGGFIASQLLTLFILFGYVGWMLETYDLVKSDIFFNNEELKVFNNYILVQSTVLEVVIFLTLAVLFLIQSAFLIRFVIEKFQAKLS